MPLSRQQVRQNLVSLLQFQMMRDREYGDLLLAAWYGIEEQAQDVFVLEVFEKFASPQGSERDMLRFPGMGNLWIPGLYMLSVFSRAEFERAAADSDALIRRVRADLHGGVGEILWPQNASNNKLANTLLG